MKKLLCLLAIITLGPSFTVAQKHANCSTAMEVNSETFGPVSPSGAVDKSVLKPGSHGLFFEHEHNITWLVFDIPEDTVLTFDITPQNSHDDINFLLFRDDEDMNEMFCKKIAEHKIKPVRTNLAKTDTIMHNGVTGLSLTATDSVVMHGDNPQYSRSLRVKKNER